MTAGGDELYEVGSNFVEVSDLTEYLVLWCPPSSSPFLASSIVMARLELIVGSLLLFFWPTEELGRVMNSSASI